jgi:5-methylthioadenosine/S-adenosylhomocysteine deaminase
MPSVIVPPTTASFQPLQWPFMHSSDLLLRNCDVALDRPGHSISGPVDILVRAGVIVEVGRNLAPGPDIEVIEAAGRLVAPGLVNAHWHSPMQLSHGTSDRTNHKVFMWENQVDTANRTPHEIYVSAVVGCLQMLKSGTTSVLDHFPEQGFTVDDVATVVRAFEDCGMRAVVALRIFDEPYSDILPPPDQRSPALLAALQSGNTLVPRPTEDSLEIVREAISRFDRHAGRIRIFPAPSNPVRCSDKLLLGCEEIARAHDTGVHCHMLETRAQAEIAERRYGTTVIEHMDRIGAYSGRWSNAHCNWVSDNEIAIMARLGAIAVLNPESNLKIGSGVPPIPKLVAAGVPCALGTDGASTNDNLVLQDAMQLAAMLHRPMEPDRRRWITVKDVMTMATAGGAKAMLEPDLGRIAPGAKADLVLYDLAESWWTPLNDPEQQFVFGERGGSVDTVVVAGRVVLKNGRSTLVDEDALLFETRDMLGQIRSRNSGVAAIAHAVAASE